MNIAWSRFPFVRYTPAFMLGVVACLGVGEGWPPLWPWALGAAAVAATAALLAARHPRPAPTDAAGLFMLLALGLLGAARTQQATESRSPVHIGRILSQIEAYRAVVDDYTVTRPATYATTLRVQAVRVRGRWRPAVGGIRMSLPRATGLPAPAYGQLWLVRGRPDLSKPPLNPGEFDYRQYLDYRQVYHQQFIHPDQFRILGLAPPNPLVAWSIRAATVLDGVFRHYLHAPREYAIASALVLGIKDEVTPETKQAYTATGTTHIMAVSGLQVGLLFAALTWALGKLFGRVRGFRYWSAAVGLAVIWSYAFLTGLSASVLRAAVMFSFVIVGRALGRQDNIFNTLAVAAFFLLLWNPFLVADVGFQLSFLAVLSIVYLQPRIARWADLQDYFNGFRRPWQARPLQWWWRGVGWVSHSIWQAVALSLAAQVATFPLSIYYFHQFPLSFLVSNLVAVPISSYSVYVGLILLVLKGLVALLGLLLSPAANALLDYLPRAVAWVFERMVWGFNEYIFWVARTMQGAVVREIHLSGAQALLMFAGIGAILAWLGSRRLAWLRTALGLAAAYAGSRVAEARAVARSAEFIVYSIPRRSALGFWDGATAEFVTPDSVPLNNTERTYRLLPGIIQRQARRTRYGPGWRGTAVAAQCLAPMPTDTSSNSYRYAPHPAPLVLTAWRGLRLGIVSGPLAPATAPAPVQVLVLRRNARVRPETLAAAFGTRAHVVFDSSCKIWYVARLDSALQAHGFHTWDVTARGAFRLAVR